MLVESAAAAAAAKLSTSIHPDFLPANTQRQELAQAMQMDRLALASLKEQIDHTKSQLRGIISDHQSRISVLQSNVATLQAGINDAAAIVASIRKLPPELLTGVFAIVQDPWSCSGVCRKWRRVALDSHALWTRVHLRIVGSEKSVDTIRLWLSRAGDSLPLDIEVDLFRRRKERDGFRPSARSPIRPSYTDLRPTEHPNWTHINLFYLFQCAKRWKRFVLKFDCELAHISTLNMLHGETPLLEEFAILRKDPLDNPIMTREMYNGEWRWLPVAGPAVAPKLREVTLRNVPFDFGAPFFRCGGMERLTLARQDHRCSSAHALHQLLSANAATLKFLHIEAWALTDPSVPLTKLTLPALTELAIAGGSGVMPVIQVLSTPALSSLVLDVDPHDGIAAADALHELLIRSDLPQLKSLDIGTLRHHSMFTYEGGHGRDFADSEVLAKLTDVRTLRLSVHIDDANALLLALGDVQSPAFPHLEKLVLQIPLRGGHEALSALIDGIKGRIDSGSSIPALELFMEIPLAKEREAWLKERVPKFEVKYAGEFVKDLILNIEDYPIPHIPHDFGPAGITLQHPPWYSASHLLNTGAPYGSSDLPFVHHTHSAPPSVSESEFAAMYGM